MTVAQLTYDLERAAKEFRETTEVLERMKIGGVNVDLSIAHTYVGSHLDEGETADLNALALSYLERRVEIARARLVGLGLNPEALEIKL